MRIWLLALLVTSSAVLAEESDRPLQLQLVPNLSAPPLVVAPTEPSKPLLHRWYFWAAIGASATAVSVATAVLAGVAQSVAPRRAQVDVCAGATCNACIGLSCR
jgi:hypothetical protein